MRLFQLIFIIPGLAVALSACAPVRADITSAPQLSATTITTTTPVWFDMELVDVQTGETFKMSDYKGKVVLLETMAIWCPNCIVQSNELWEFCS